MASELLGFRVQDGRSFKIVRILGWWVFQDGRGSRSRQLPKPLLMA